MFRLSLLFFFEDCAQIITNALRSKYQFKIVSITSNSLVLEIKAASSEDLYSDIDKIVAANYLIVHDWSLEEVKEKAFLPPPKLKTPSPLSKEDRILDALMSQVDEIITKNSNTLRNKPGSTRVPC